MDKQRLPQHIAIIMDGNGRWAKKRRLPRVSGHRKGVAVAKEIITLCVKKRIACLTLFAFSSENWQRPAAEVKLLMSLLQRLLQEEAQALHKKQVRLRVVGDIVQLNPAIQAAIAKAQQLTQYNTGLQLNIAFNYGGRWDLLTAARSLCADVEQGRLKSGDLSEQHLQNRLVLSDLPEPDLLIRTSGEQRISNFMLWQLAYAELFFTETLWPDFSEQDLEQALQFFTTRERRFGLISEQVELVAHG